LSCCSERLRKSGGGAAVETRNTVFCAKALPAASANDITAMSDFIFLPWKMVK
jgi:hypothetical protein